MRPLRTTKTRQQRIFEFIKFSIAANDEAPTIREIGEYFGMTSSGSIHIYLKRLEHEGLIKRSRRHRGIEVVEHPSLTESELMIAGREG